MIAFLLSPLGRKIALYAALAVAAFFAYRWWSNKIWESGYDDGKRAGITEAEEAHKKEWKEREEQLRQMEVAATQKDASAELALTSARKVQTNASRVLESVLAQSQGRLQATHDMAVDISADVIDDALRRLSAELGPPQSR